MTQRNMFRELQLKIYDFVYCDTVIQPSPLVDGPPGGVWVGGQTYPLFAPPPPGQSQSGIKMTV